MSSNTTTTQQPEKSFYGYVPTLWICYTFLVLFTITTVLHLGEALYFKPRRYWLLPTVVMCGVGEVIGWSSRLWSSKNPTSYTAFIVQLVTTIISPTFLTAALYTILGGIIRPLGTQYSRLSTRNYVIVFVSADILALVVQSAGGAIASGASTQAGSDLGSHIMLAGIFLQTAGLTLYTIFATEFLLRFYYQKPTSPVPSSQVSLEIGENSPLEKNFPYGKGQLDGRGLMPPRLSMMIVGLVLATVLVYIRTIYRTIELFGGWDGRIITTEIYFNLLDATPIVLAMAVLNVFTPSVLLQVSGAT